jgi:hypothetical protein
MINGAALFSPTGQVVNKVGAEVTFLPIKRGVAVQMSLQLFTIQPTLIRFERRREAKKGLQPGLVNRLKAQARI